MPLFRKRPAPDAGIAEFWQWWPAARPRIEAAVASGDWADLVPEMARRVEAIDPGLEWEFGHGHDGARHALVVCASGRPELRATAARWLAAAPPPDPVWEFHAHRQPDPEALRSSMRIADMEFTMADVRFGFTTDPDRPEIDVVCHHPAFATLPEGACVQVTFLALDWTLGERDVELWIGAVDWQRDPLPDGREPAALRAAVAALAAGYTKPVWALMSAETDKGHPLMASVQVPLKSIRWPRFDTHVGVTLPYRENQVGLPTDDELRALREFEDGLTGAVSGDGDLIAHETSRGRRVLHFYVDGDSGAADEIEGAAVRWHSGRPTVKRAADPSFERVAHLRP
jgi:hypothetical protein